MATEMTYETALKKVTAEKPKDNFMVIEFGYNQKVLLPYKDGTNFLVSLNNAEQLHEPYNEQHRIKEFDRSSMSVRIMSHAEYVRFKIAALLGVKPEDVKPTELIAA